MIHIVVRIASDRCSDLMVLTKRCMAILSGMVITVGDEFRCKDIALPMQLNLLRIIRA